MQVKNKMHLSYCTNIHPGQDWKSTFNSIKSNVPYIKKQVSLRESFGLGLRLSNKASEELGHADNMYQFKEWLKAEDVYIFTMNGFPYGNFHDERVKDLVHAPDWTTKERVVYTKRLFHQLATLLPTNINGGISTSPITYKHWHKTKKKREMAFTVGASNMIAIAMELKSLEDTTAKYMHLDIEPEPDGLLENSDEVLSFFNDYLLPIGIIQCRESLNINAKEAEKLIKRYITVCYDICHFSLAYEEPSITFNKFENAGILIGKIQVSAALKVLFNRNDNEQIWKELSQFNEPTYLHQVTMKKGNKVITYNDLPIVLEDKKQVTELRAHYHVPIFLEQYGTLFSTQDHILKTMHYLDCKKVTEHLEIETYTWDVLPLGLKQNVSESIVREIKWLKQFV